MEFKTKHCVDIIKNIRSFLINKEVDVSNFCLKESVDNVLRLLHNEMTESDILIENNVAKCVVSMSSIELDQVLLNLLKNSISAINSNDESRQLHISCEIKNLHAYLSIQDTGGGIDNPENLFELFKSNKRKNDTEGIGIGLNLSRSVMRSYGGDLILEKTTNMGSIFVVKIPLKGIE
jgi:C4-dicarboxylate-specific signal transduction histidine kinase